MKVINLYSVFLIGIFLFQPFFLLKVQAQETQASFERRLKKCEKAITLCKQNLNKPGRSLDLSRDQLASLIESKNILEASSVEDYDDNEEAQSAYQYCRQVVGMLSE